MDLDKGITPKWINIKRNYLDTLYASLFFSVFYFGILFFINELVKDYYKDEWTKTQFSIILLILIGALVFLCYMTIPALFNEVSLWRSLRGMWFIDLKISGDQINAIIMNNLTKNNIAIEPFDRQRWREKLYLIHSNRITYKGQSCYILIGDTSNEDENPDTTVYIGPLTGIDKGFQRILMTSIIETTQK